MHFPLTESTPVHLAAGEGHEAVLEILLDKGGDVNSKDNNGETNKTTWEFLMSYSFTDIELF